MQLLVSVHLPQVSHWMCIITTVFFIGIYLMHSGDCYPNGAYFWDDSIRSKDNTLSCVLPGQTGTGQWVRVADPFDAPVNCNGGPFRCTSVSTPNATISLYLRPDQGLSEAQAGLYKCCLPTDCSSATNTITVNIFSKKV